MTQIRTIHRELTERRINAGKTIKGLAAELGVHEHIVRKLERGQRVSPESAKIVADWLGCKVTDLMPLAEAAA